MPVPLRAIPPPVSESCEVNASDCEWVAGACVRVAHLSAVEKREGNWAVGRFDKPGRAWQVFLTQSSRRSRRKGNVKDFSSKHEGILPGIIYQMLSKC